MGDGKLTLTKDFSKVMETEEFKLSYLIPLQRRGNPLVETAQVFI